MEKFEKENIRHILIHGEGTQIERVHQYCKAKIRYNDFKWAVCFIVSSLVFICAYIQLHEASKRVIDANMSGKQIDSLFSYKLDSCINYTNRPFNNVLIKLGKDTLK